MTPHSSENKTADFDAAVAEFRRALDRRVDAHLRAHPHAGVPRVARATAPRGSTRLWAPGMAIVMVIMAIGGAIIWPRGVRVYAAGNDGLQVALTDRSRVEMRAHSEMTVDRSDGLRIYVRNGDIIVTAADQREAPLYVQTKDLTIDLSDGASSANLSAGARRAKADDTVFLVNAAQDGSRVGVIEGEVRVQEGNRETRLRPGEQVATSSTIVPRPLTEGIAWSRNATAHQALLDSLKGLAQAVTTLAPVAPPAQAAAASSQAAKTEFEEASIRPCDPNNLPPGGRGSAANFFRMTPGRTYATCLTLATLIRTAYGAGLLDGPAIPNRRVGRLTAITPDGRVIALPDPRDFSGIGAMSFDGPWQKPASAGSYFLGVEDGVKVRGGPDWVRSELYTIEAVAGGPADAQTMRGPMLRALLERRFGVKVHVETEQFPALKLTVAPGGLKMREGICTKAETPSVGGGRAAQMAQMVAAVRTNLDAVRRGVPVTGRCGGAFALNGPNLLMVGAGHSIEPLVEFLAEGLEVPVIDQTGIPTTALFNFVLEFGLDDSLSRKARDQITAAGNELQIASDPSTVPRAPGLVTAVEEQLGLRLERVRAPRQFIVIDQVERPAPN